MARISVGLPDFDITIDVSTNPENLLMQAQGDDDQVDVSLSIWLSGNAVTKPKHSNYESD